MHNDTGFLLDQMWGLDCHGRYLSRELSGITTPHFAYGVQLWVNSLIPLTVKQYKMKEHREKSPIPFFLQTSLSLSYLLYNSMLKELFGKALKCNYKKQEARRKNKLNRKKWQGNLFTITAPRFSTAYNDQEFKFCPFLKKILFNVFLIGSRY